MNLLAKWTTSESMK